ncbi:hypothetical protein ABG775_12195 [Peribacillus simplex]|nr:hypothetical protein [Brevibacillus sp. JNUCC-41]QOS89118.1 hypothetical protein JNUCC41_20445 [Brevibacillus sp. JNUCC-41]
MKYHQNGRNYRHLVQTAVREQISGKVFSEQNGSIGFLPKLDYSWTEPL